MTAAFIRLSSSRVSGSCTATITGDWAPDPCRRVGSGFQHGIQFLCFHLLRLVFADTPSSLQQFQQFFCHTLLSPFKMVISSSLFLQHFRHTQQQLYRTYIISTTGIPDAAAVREQNQRQTLRIHIGPSGQSRNVCLKIPTPNFSPPAEPLAFFSGSDLPDLFGLYHQMNLKPCPTDAVSSLPKFIEDMLCGLPAGFSQTEIAFPFSSTAAAESSASLFPTGCQGQSGSSYCSSRSAICTCRKERGRRVSSPCFTAMVHCFAS